MKFLAPEFLPLSLGIVVIIALYMILRRRVILRTGYYRLWLEAAQELGYKRRIRLRKLISILLATTIFGFLVIALMQPVPEKIDANQQEKREKHAFIVVDTFFETFPYIEQTVKLRKILQKISANETKGKLYFQDDGGFHIRSLKDAESIEWHKRLLFEIPDIAFMLNHVARHSKPEDDILLVTLNKAVLEPALASLDQHIQSRVKFLRIFEENATNVEKSDIAVIKIEQNPKFPFDVENLTVTVKNYSNMPAHAEIIVHPGAHILQKVDIESFEEINISIPLEILTKIYENSEHEEFSFTDAVTAKNPLYFHDLTQKYTINREFPVLLELRNQSNTYDLRPANNFAFLTANNHFVPKVSVIGEDANNDFVRILFDLLQESRILKLVKLKDSPEVVIQLGKSVLKIPDNAHIIKFVSTFVEMNAPSAYFWKNSSLFDAEPLQKLFFSLKNVSFHIPNTGETLLDSSAGILGKITHQNSKIIVHFSFSISPMNSDFLVRSEIAPTLFSKIIRAFFKNEVKFRLKPAYFTDENIDFSCNHYIENLILKSPGADKFCEFSDLCKNEIHPLPNPAIPGISQLQTPEKVYSVAVNTIRTDINLDESSKLNMLIPPKKPPENPQKRADDNNTRFMILFIQIAFLLVITETILYKIRLTE